MVDRLSILLIALASGSCLSSCASLPWPGTNAEDGYRSLANASPVAAAGVAAADAMIYAATKKDNTSGERHGVCRIRADALSNDNPCPPINLGLRTSLGESYLQVRVDERGYFSAPQNPSRIYDVKVESVHYKLSRFEERSESAGRRSLYVLLEQR